MKNDVTAEMLRALNEELAVMVAARPSAQPAPIQVLRPVEPNSLQHLAGRASVPETPDQIQKLKSALAALSPDVPRGHAKLFEPGDTATSDNYWLIGVWGVASLGWAGGKEIVRKWSMQSSRYTEEGFERAWAAYDPTRTDAMGIGSLYKLAQQRGWVQPAKDPEHVPADGARYKLLSSTEIRSLQPLQWRVKGILPATGIAALFGPSGSGKSFLAADLAAAIALGLTWFGARTCQAPVLYVMLEGEGGIQRRVAALELARGPLPADKFSLVMQPFHLTVVQDVADLAAVVPDGAVVFIDTLNRAAPTADENSSKEMGLILQGVKQLQADTGGLVVVIHHTGKDPTKGMRGHSSLHAALDAAIEVERDSAGKRRWSVAKAKDGEDGKQFAFRLKQHLLGQDSDGDDITSCSVEQDASTIFVKPEPRGVQQKLAMKVVKSALAGPQASTGVTGCPSGARCMTVEDAVAAVASSLTTVASNKRKNEARRLVTALTMGGYLESVIDGNGEGWCWIE